jgi:hypothetical protein
VINGIAGTANPIPMNATMTNSAIIFMFSMSLHFASSI